MQHRIRTVVAAVVVASAAASGVGPAAAAPAEAAEPTGWVVENPRADGLFLTDEGSATVVNVTTGATVSCPVLYGSGEARSRTMRPQDLFGSTEFTAYGYEAGGCTGPGLGILSTPNLGFAVDAHDAAADRVDGSAVPLGWGFALDAPDCLAEAYPEVVGAASPLTYDNRTGAFEIGPVDVVVTRADGPGCAGLARVGDDMTFEATLVATPAFTVRPL